MNKLGKKTEAQYNEIIDICKSLFINKTADYGASWRVMRISSVIDQLFIKAQRIKTIDELGEKKVNEGIESEFIGIVNYSIIGLIQLELGESSKEELPSKSTETEYIKHVTDIKSLMVMKNHDYGEAWRDMQVSSFTDMILMKIMRLKNIQHNNGKTLVSEGIDANFRDIVNYAIFALIKLKEGDESIT